MGIRDLKKLLNARAPDAFRTVAFDTYAGRRVAVDASVYMFRYKMSLGANKWLEGFMDLVHTLVRFQVVPVIVFDGKSPVEKLGEKQRRKNSRQDTKKRLATIRSELDAYKATGTVGPNLTVRRSFLTGGSVNVQDVEERIERLERSLQSVTTHDTQRLQAALTEEHIEWLTAKGEAERLCAALACRGDVYAALSEDSDLYAHASPKILSELNLKMVTFTEVDFSELLDMLELSQESFVDLCVLLGTDFNERIHGIGPVRAFSLISRYKCIDTLLLEKKDLDGDCLNHVVTRALLHAEEEEHE